MRNLQNYILSKGYANGSIFGTSAHSYNSEGRFKWEVFDEPVAFFNWLSGEAPAPDCNLSLQLIDSQLYMMMITMGKSCEVLLLALLLLASYICIYLEFSQPRCLKPFVEIGNSCYFFSTNKAPTYEFYRVSYKGRDYSVPVMLDWLRASFACETLDPSARLLTIESAEEMRHLAHFIERYAHTKTHAVFWSGGHRGNVASKQFDKASMNFFYWHNDSQPMNFTNFARGQTKPSKRFSEGYCIYLEALGSELIMNSANCKQPMAYACEMPFL
ncbi:hypothetical protein KR222_010936 [Zaprionus bogoriensis]|nr:hypothetical protein KR222_010936 [Zaprionus bogoriensis]